ncbi:MAG: hypothetical protein ACRDTT_21270 [Pseudonocardiaceae bacterium]
MEPNQFNLTGSNDTVIVFSTTGFGGGGPRLHYEDEDRELDFSGDEIIVLENSSLGTLVTVTLENVPDLQLITFTLLVPNVNLGDREEIEFDTLAIVTTNHTTLAGPEPGPLQTYRRRKLEGVARLIPF